MFIVFDLDGTLANIEHRLHYIHGEEQDWQGFFKACVYDAPIQHMIDNLNWYAKNSHWVEIWTGRSDLVRDETEEWLIEYGAESVDCLRMRPDGDHRPDHKLKQTMLSLHPHRPDLVFEDRTAVVNMWRANGIHCIQVAPGDF